MIEYTYALHVLCTVNAKCVIDTCSYTYCCIISLIHIPFPNPGQEKDETEWYPDIASCAVTKSSRIYLGWISPSTARCPSFPEMESKNCRIQAHVILKMWEWNMNIYCPNPTESETLREKSLCLREINSTWWEGADAFRKSAKGEFDDMSCIDPP